MDFDTTSFLRHVPAGWLVKFLLSLTILIKSVVVIFFFLWKNLRSSLHFSAKNGANKTFEILKTCQLMTLLVLNNWALSSSVLNIAYD